MFRLVVHCEEFHCECVRNTLEEIKTIKRLFKKKKGMTFTISSVDTHVPDFVRYIEYQILN